MNGPPSAAPRALCTLALAACCSTPCAATSAAAAPAIDVHHVALDLRLDEAARRVDGTATLTLAPLVATREVRLDAVALAIDSVRLVGPAGAGTTTLAFTLDAGAEDGALRITLPRTWAAGEALTVAIRYRSTHVNGTDPGATWGSTGRGLRFLAPGHADPRRTRQIWPGPDPGSARRWFPGHDVPGDLRTSELALTVARPLVVAGTGRPAGVSDNADGTRTFRFRTDVPEPNHRTAFVAGEFAAVTQHAGPVRLTSLGLADERAGVEASVGALPSMLAFFADWLGEPFPHRHHTQIFVRELPWNAIGTGLAVITENAVDDFGTHADFHYLWHGALAESLLQQWFGGLVAPCGWHEAWLERGLAHHLAGLWAEHLNGRAEQLLWFVLADQGTALADAAAGVHEAVVEPAPADLAAFVAGNAPYARAGAVLHLLRAELGDAAWRDALRHFVRTQRGRVACSAALQASVEAVAGRSFAAFFAQWVHGRGHPVFEVSHAFDAAAGRLVLTLRQVQQPLAAGEPVRWFGGTMDIRLDDRLERVVLEPRAENRFEFALAAGPRHVLVDPAGTWLKELKLSTPPALDDTLHLYATTDEPLARQAALTALVRAFRDARTTAAEREAIVDAITAIAASLRHYWRERFNALGQLGAVLGPATAPAAAAPSATPAAAATPIALKPALEAALLAIVRDEDTWLRAAALRVLGLARDARHAPLFIAHLADPSDRVINAAAIALGRTGAPTAFDALAGLPRHPSWKNQSLISTLAGLKELGDPRGLQIALTALADREAARWTLVTTVWDFRLTAADTLVALAAKAPAWRDAEGRAPIARAHELVAARLEVALAARDVNDLFADLNLLVAIGDTRAAGWIERVRAFAAGDARMTAVLDGHAKALGAR